MPSSEYEFINLANLDPHAHHVHPVKVLGQEEGLEGGGQQHQDRVQHAPPHRLVAGGKLDDPLEELGRDEDHDVVDELQDGPGDDAPAERLDQGPGHGELLAVAPGLAALLDDHVVRVGSARDRSN